MIANTAPARKNNFNLMKRACVIFSHHLNKTPLISFGMTGVISTCTFHSCPEIRGCTGMYCTASEPLDGQTPKLHHLGQAEPDGDRPDILRRRIPVHQDITRIPEAPALVEEERGDGLQVHLVSV